MSNTPTPTQEQVEAARTWTELAEMLGANARNDRMLSRIKRFVKQYFPDAALLKRTWTRGSGGNSYYTIADETFIAAVKSSRSISEALRTMGLVARGGAYKSFAKRAEKLSLSLDHFTGQGWNIGNTGPKLNIEHYLVLDGPTIGSNNLKHRLIREGLKTHQCEKCKRTEWEGDAIPIALDHINGNHGDNRIENLQILCPNCHA